MSNSETDSSMVSYHKVPPINSSLPLWSVVEESQKDNKTYTRCLCLASTEKDADAIVKSLQKLGTP